MIQSVTGPLAPQDLGVTLMHEHLLLDARLSWQEPDEASLIRFAHRPVSPDMLHLLRHNPFMNLDNCSLFDEHTAAEEVAQFRDFGGRTVVDATCRAIGRDPAALRRIAFRTGLNIIMGTGYYLERTHPPHVSEASVEKLEQEMINDLTGGVGETGIRAGFIGEIGTGSQIAPQEEKVLRAAARAQAETNVALMVHLDGWQRWGHKVLDIIKGEGSDLSRTVLCHMNPSHDDVDYQTSLADRGAYLEYDMIGLDYYFASQNAQSPSDAENARAVHNLIERGYTDKLLLSQDVFLKMMLTRYGGNGYAHINRHFLPRLRRHGVSEEAIHVMMVKNPARVLGGL